MSKPNEDFKFYGSVFTDENDNPILVTVDPNDPDITNWTRANRAAAERMVNDIRPLTNPDNVAYWDQFNNRRNRPNFCFDNTDISVNNWQRGLYLFVIYDEKGERVQTSKVSVQ